MNILLLLVEFIHLINDLFISFYVFIFYWTKKYDLYFIIYFSLINLHWYIFKNECIISYFEKIIIDKNYKLGDNPYYHPFQSHFPKSLFNFLYYFKILQIFIIFFRNSDNYIILSFILTLIIFKIYNIKNDRESI